MSYIHDASDNDAEQLSVAFVERLVQP